MAIRYTKREEQWNTWSHASGIVMGIIVGVIFFIICSRGDNPWARFGVSLYLFGMLGSYAASTFYHAMPRRNPWKERLRRWDHAAIYWHIAGSYSPLTPSSPCANRDTGDGVSSRSYGSQPSPAP